MSVTANFLQIVSVVVFAAYIFFMEPSRLASLLLKEEEVAVVFIIMLIIIFNSLVSIRTTLSMYKVFMGFMDAKKALSDLAHMNVTLRTQRHDFLNNLQVVYGLMQMNEYSEATDYIEKVYGDIQRLGKVLKTANPPVNALLQAKMDSCEKRGIKIEFDIKTRFANLTVPDWEICRVLGNLIDNAIESFEGIDTENNIKITFIEDIKSYIIDITDNGKGIPEKLREKIFESGFTTKIGKGQGLGLSTSNELIKNHGGSINLITGETFKTFRVIVPKAVV